MECLKEKRIYALCPANVVTGGVELLHQLVDFLNCNGREAYIVYFGDNNTFEVPEAYRKYNIKIAKEAADDTNSCIVFPEGYLGLSKDYTLAVKVFWWMSVDNFFFLSRHELSLFDLFGWNKHIFLRELVRRVVYRKEYKILNKISISELSDKAINAFQSEYARLFLERHHFTNIVPLSDYINQDYLNNSTKEIKEKVVLYNPHKELIYTKKIMLHSPEFKWIPLVGLTRQQMRERLSTSMVYIDFGQHPGKDRIPREAAMSGCCIITGRKGAANNQVDIPIAEDYKFNDNKANISKIINLINEIFSNYERHYAAQKTYREKILLEKQVFESEITRLFEL